MLSYWKRTWVWAYSLSTVESEGIKTFITPCLPLPSNLLTGTPHSFPINSPSIHPNPTSYLFQHSHININFDNTCGRCTPAIFASNSGLSWARISPSISIMSFPTYSNTSLALFHSFSNKPQFLAPHKTPTNHHYPPFLLHTQPLKRLQHPVYKRPPVTFHSLSKTTCFPDIQGTQTAENSMANTLICLLINPAVRRNARNTFVQSLICW